MKDKKKVKKLLERKALKAHSRDLKGLGSASHIQKAKLKLKNKQSKKLRKRIGDLKTSTPKQPTLLDSTHLKNKKRKKSQRNDGWIQTKLENTSTRNPSESTKKNWTVQFQSDEYESHEGSDSSSHSENEEFYIKEYLLEPETSNLLCGFKESKTEGNRRHSNILRNFSKEESDHETMEVAHSSLTSLKDEEKQCQTPYVNLDKEMGDLGKSCFFSYPSKNTLIVILDKGESLSFVGLVNIRVITGTISVLGIDITYGMPPVSAYSSHKHCYLNIEAKSSARVLKNTTLLAQLKGRLGALASKQLTSDVFLRYNNTSVIFLLEKSQPSMALNFVRLYMPSAFRANYKTSDASWLYPYDIKASLKHEASINVSIFQSVAIKVVNLIQISKVELTPAPRILVYGEKNIGKSTFLCYLMNQALQKFDKVCYLDCDPGQSEFTVPGCVSLLEVTEPVLGPPCTHLKDPLMAVFIGSTTAETSPEMYCNSITKLVEHYKANYASYPLFINTMGWLSGIGAECLTRAINAVLPTLSIELICENKLSSYTYVQPQNAEEIAEHISVPVHRWKKTYIKVLAPEKRNLTVLSYFGKCLHSFDQLMPLNAIEPYRISWDNLALYVFNIYVSPDKLPEAMNASLVALCRVNETLILSSHIHSYPKTLSDEPDNECFGFGIVRAMHQTKHLFYIVTPVPIEKLKMVNALLKGNVAVPSELFLMQNEIVNTQIPYTKVIVDVPPLTSKASKTNKF